MLDWLTSLPPLALYTAMTALAFAENIFPPIPADVLVAFGGFLAARAGSSPWIPFLCVWLGNVAGAVTLYMVGRRLGAPWIRTRFHLVEGGDAETRFRLAYAKYGLPAIFLSRFLPGVRAVVPPFAGAFGIAITGTTVAIAIASGLWYGAITAIAFRAGSSWETLVATISRFGKWTGIFAALIVAIVALIWFMRRQRRA